MLSGLEGHRQLREEAAGPVLLPGLRLLGDSSKTDLLGCFGAEAIGVESQWVLKVCVHPPHDVGAELPGRGSACLWFQGGPLTPPPLTAATQRGGWERSSPPTPTPLLHPLTSAPTHLGQCGISQALESHHEEERDGPVSQRRSAGRATSSHAWPRPVGEPQSSLLDR